MHRAVVVLVGLPLLAGCLTLPVEQRTTHGPMADQVWSAQIAGRTGRAPSFEERGAWQDQIDRRISRFLAEHPEIANQYDVHSFRFDKQVSVGMMKEQVVVLLGAPEAATTDVKEMEKLARKFWPSMKDKVSEVWLYPLGWRVFLHEGKVVDLVQYMAPRGVF